MPHRIGVDLVSISDVESALKSHAERYLARIYTARELGDCKQGGQVSAQRLAARFAAKEATLKVLRPADEAIPWREIEVVGGHAGSPVGLKLAGRAAEKALEADVTSLALTVTHEAGLASAVVVANCNPRVR
jgi:holo-[acyl-carrier protein] synthase